MTKQVESHIVHYKLNFKNLCLVTLSFPLAALVICFVTGYIFQPDDIHETHCRVFNIIPSISAITGISPQRYLWRISMAFHIGPRLIIAAVHRAYHINLLNVTNQVNSKAKIWLNASFWLSLIEIGSLLGVTYISNRENYPIHEKMFITFMVSSLLHMITSIKGLYLCNINTDESKKNLERRKTLLITSLVSAALLVIFFLQHRLLCHRMAFSFFALAEYVIAIANLSFHLLDIMDFPTEYLIIGKDYNMANNKLS